jgi:DNA helicase II / ATP-dependent DNA helicase PcrA
VPWPANRPEGERTPLERAAALVREALAGPDDRGALDAAGQEARARWAHEVDVLLAERDAGRTTGTVVLPAHLSASRLVRLAEDPQALAAEVRRPLPAPPRPQTRRGTAFHAWLERRFRAAALVDVDEVPGAADLDAGPDTELPRLQRSFLASAWASRTPTAVEVDVETVVDGAVLRGRIDAVFAAPGGGWEVVDWKTGVPPTGAAARARAVQLAVYRLAWARLRKVPLEAVSAAFFYASTGETVRPVDLLDEAGLVELLGRVPVGGSGSGGPA